MTVWSRPSAHLGVQGGQARYILGLPPSRCDGRLPILSLVYFVDHGFKWLQARRARYRAAARAVPNQQ